MCELEEIGKVFTSKFIWIGPSSYEKRIYRSAVTQSLRNTTIEDTRTHSNQTTKTKPSSVEAFSPAKSESYIETKVVRHYTQDQQPPAPGKSVSNTYHCF